MTILIENTFVIVFIYYAGGRKAISDALVSNIDVDDSPVVGLNSEVDSRHDLKQAIAGNYNVALLCGHIAIGRARLKLRPIKSLA